MKKEIVVAVAASLITALILFLLGQAGVFAGWLLKQGLADTIVQKIKNMPDFKGQDGRDGRDGAPGDGVRVGTIVPYAGPVVRSRIQKLGWLLCDGDTYPISEYPELYDVIADHWSGIQEPPQDEFRVPDLRGMFIRGLDSERGIDPSVNRSIGSRQEDAFQGHAHDIRQRKNDPNGNPLFLYQAPHRIVNLTNDSSNMIGLNTTNTSNAFRATAVEPDLTQTNEFPRIAPETRPKNVAVNFIIKY